ncbi:MAG: aminoacyl-tRNA hydrolase [Solirubrobacteraceae bacterium]
MKKRLIVGLGNIGEKYQNTRHNIGFKIVDKIANTKEVPFSAVNFGQMAKISHKGRETLLLKPNTFMNLSGKAVLFWLKKEKIELEHLLIIVDDIYLPFGTFRLREKGSNAGHNGLKSVEEALQSNAYNRLRFGVGNDDFKATDQVDFVLGNWNKTEETLLENKLKDSAELVLYFIFNGLANTMNNFNNK